MAYILPTAYLQKEESHFVPVRAPHPQHTNKLWTCFQGFNEEYFKLYST